MSLSDVPPRRAARLTCIQAATADAPPFNVYLYHDGANAATNATTDARRANATADNKPTRHAAALRPPPKKYFSVPVTNHGFFSVISARQSKRATQAARKRKNNRHARHATQKKTRKRRKRHGQTSNDKRRAKPPPRTQKKFCTTCHKRQKFFRYKCKAKRKRKRKAEQPAKP